MSRERRTDTERLEWLAECSLDEREYVFSDTGTALWQAIDECMDSGFTVPAPLPDGGERLAAMLTRRTQANRTNRGEGWRYVVLGIEEAEAVAALLTESSAPASLLRGLEQSARGEVHDLGSFAHYANESDDGRPGAVCPTHGKAVLVTHVDDGKPCDDYLRAPRPDGGGRTDA